MALDRTIPLNKEFVEKFAYLFLVDVDALLFTQKDLADFESFEKNYTEALLQAYIAAFSTPIFRMITSDFAKKLHAVAMNHMPEKTPGQFRAGAGAFAVRATSTNPRLKLSNPASSVAGIKEFINYWFIETDEPMHILIFQPTNPSKPTYLLQAAHNKSEREITWVTMLGGKVVDAEKFSFEKHFPFIEKLLSDWSLYTPNIQTNLADENSSPKIYAEKYEASLKKLCNEYNQQILAAKTSNDKLKSIITYVQHSVQLHCFFDGNTRLGCLMLNRLLHEEWLSCALLINPNRIECFSVSELMIIVKHGQQAFKQFCENTLPLFKDASHKENITAELCAAVKSESLPAKAETIEQFIRHYLAANYYRAYPPFLVRHFDKSVDYTNNDFCGKPKP
ncbi:MAG: Fic family protein [Gammaproteobacteria bacterium]|nr:Fic family protein [Gammaproteobacteria bacterium]